MKSSRLDFGFDFSFGPGQGGTEFQQVAGLSQFPSRAVANSNSFTQVQMRKAFFLYRPVTKLKFRFCNALSTAASDVALPDCTLRVGLYDPAASAYHDLNFGGQASIVLAHGQAVETDEVAIDIGSIATMTGGKKLYLIKFASWATAPANFPAASVICTERDYSEWGNALTDKTRSGSFASAFTAGNWDIMPAVAIMGLVKANTPVVGILGDSISSDGSGDTLQDYHAGWATYGLAMTGIPHVNIGVSSLSLSTFMGAGYDVRRARLYATLRAARVTHLLCPLVTNDWAGGQTAAQILANLDLLDADMAEMGIALIPCTAPPKTNAANNAQNGSETETWTQRLLFNAAIAANNGVGKGFYDVALRTEGAENRWRTDLRKVSSAAVQAGGSGYTTNDQMYFGYGIRMRATVTAGAVSSLTTRRVGGFAADPSNPIAQLQSLSQAFGGGTSGAGCTINLTTTAANLDTADGIHPGASYHSVLQVGLEDEADDLFGWAA